MTGSPSFKDIVSTVLRRITNIAYFYCGVELEADFRELVNKADKVKFTSQFRRSEQSRYSARQKTRMDLDGILGEMTIFDCPPEIFNWLTVGTKLGIGKNTSMGMGGFIIKA